MKKTRMILAVLISLFFIFSAQTLAYKNLYVDELGVDFSLQPSNDSEMNYLPLKQIAEYYGMSLNFNEKDKEIHGNWNKTIFILKVGSRVAEVRGKREILEEPVIMINGHVLVPINFVEDLIKVDFTWRKPASSIIIKPNRPEDSIKVYLYTSKEHYKFGDEIVVTMIIKNTSLQKLQIPMRSGQIYDLALSYKDHELWRWSKGKMFTTAISNFVMEAGESKVYTITLPRELVLTPAQYQLEGSFASKPAIESETAFFTIVD